MKPIAVLHIASNGHAVGGMETNLETLLRFHSRKRVTPHVAFLTSGFFSDRIAGMRPKVPVLECRAGRARYPWRTARTVLLLQDYIRDHGIRAVVTHGYHAHLYGGAAARLARVPCVLWAHSFLAPSDLRSPLVRTSLALPARLILANSEAVARTLRQHFGERRQTRVVYYGIDLRRFRAGGSPAAARRRIGIELRAPLAVMPGRLQPWKGQRTFIEAARKVADRLPTARFVMVGGTTTHGDQPYERELRSRIAALRMGNLISITGHQHDVIPFLRAAQVVVHASIEPEPFGLVLVEAMACGRPVIASEGGGPAEIVKPGFGLLTPPGDADALARAMLSLLRAPRRSSEMGKRAAVAARARYSATRMAAEVEELLEAVS